MQSKSIEYTNSLRLYQRNKSTGFGSLQQTFSLASLLNFVVAVVSGVVAEGIVDRFPYNEDPLVSCFYDIDRQSK